VSESLVKCELKNSWETHTLYVLHGKRKGEIYILPSSRPDVLFRNNPCPLVATMTRHTTRQVPGEETEGQDREQKARDQKL